MSEDKKTSISNAELADIAKTYRTKEIPSDVFEMLKQNIRRETGERIKEARESMGMSQKDLADKLSRRQAFISDLETGKTEPDVSLLVQLSYYLQKPAEFFIPPDYRELFSPIPIERESLSPEEEDLIRKIRSVEPKFSRALAFHMLNAIIEWDKKYIEWG